MINFNLIFDNGGGITLQCEGYAHHYSRAQQAAEDVKALLAGDNPADDWDGNEPDARLEYDSETERNGGYAWYTQDDLDSITEDSGWLNESEFAAAMK